MSDFRTGMSGACMSIKYLRVGVLPKTIHVDPLDGSGFVKYVPERMCKMTLKKSGPFYDVWHFDCCDKEWPEPRCDSNVVDYPGVVCPYCGAKVVE